MFMMNFLFDFGATEGLFSLDFTPGGVMFKSKNWLKLNPNDHLPGLPPVAEPTDPIPPGFNPELAVFLDQGDMDSGTLLLPSTPNSPPALDENNIGIRIVPDPRGGPLPLGPAGADLSLTVCFGKPSPARQPRSSPFEISPGVAKTTFTFAAQKSNRVDSAGTPVSWFFPLGLVKFKPQIPPNSNKHRTFRFEFSVGIEVVSGGLTRQYSHDPDFDVGP